VATLYAAGLYFLLVPVLLPGPLGWKIVVEKFGETRIFAFAIGFLFLYMAVVVREKHKLRAVTLDTLEALNIVLYGPDYRKHRYAVDLLIRALRADDAGARGKALRSLRELTGQDFGTDAAAWESWWGENRSRFRLRGGTQPSGETGRSGGSLTGAKDGEGRR